MLMGQWQKARPGTDITGMVSTARVIRFRSALGLALERCHLEAGIHSWAFDVLATLRRQPAPYRSTHRELSQLSMVSNSAVTQRIDKLVTEGYVDRIPNPESRREVYVQLTADGFDKIEEILDRHTEICNEFMAPLSAGERAQFNCLLTKLLEPLDL